ncbi:hypothetical protein [Xanthomonas sp. SI]|uniref:hypothetical protein n=1 Tax=Xanthomonas sp. SI TaxID=2724123 RepID=UPI00163A79FC|nr:hypothetical protein [Xanthomonas sp. SI]QNH13334.1 hypothetical protein HEP75_02785 [Xanthomonas sp. SI]
MARIGKWIGGGLGAVLLLAVALYLASRWWPVPAAQRAALAQLRQAPPPLQGPNLFVDLWLLPYAIPPAQRQAVLDEDLRRFRQGLAGQPLRSAASDYPRTPDWPSERVSRCNWDEDDCLAKVRARRQDYAQALAAQDALLARMPVPTAASGYRTPFPVHQEGALPAFSVLQTPPMRRALDFVEGRTDPALAGICNDGSVARVLLRSGDNMLATTIGAAMLRGNARLFAAMLAELPAQQALPAQCAQAFAPLSVDEVSLCRPLRGEARALFASLDAFDRTRAAPDERWYEALGVTLLFDRARSEALVAPAYTRTCAADVRASLRADRRLAQAQMTAPVGSPFSCLANQFGCALVSLPASNFVGGAQRVLQDTAAAMRLTSALLWLRAHPGVQPLSQRLAALPPDLRGAQRPLQATADGQGVQVALYAHSEGDALRLPLPGSRLPHRN